MNLFISLAVVLFGSFVSGQAATSFPSFPTAPIPTSPSQPAAAALISNIPACWLPCVGGAIKEVCPSDDSWACACNNYFNSNTTEFVQLAAYDTSCQSCPQNVGPSDGAEQDITGLLVNICIAMPISAASSTVSSATETATPLASTTSALKTTSTTSALKATSSTSSVSAQSTKNAAAMALKNPRWSVIVPFAVPCGLALLLE